MCKIFGMDVKERENGVGLRERQRQARDEAILAAAFALIIEKGYDSLTMEMLAEQVGISRQTLYHHFASKDDLALRAILELMEQGIRAILAVDPSLSPLTRLEKVVRWMIDFRSGEIGTAFCKAKPALLPLKSRPEYRSAFARRAEAIRRIVEDARAMGEIRQDLSDGLIVQMLFGLVSDANYEELIASGEASAEEVADAVVDLFFRGIRPPSVVEKKEIS